MKRLQNKISESRTALPFTSIYATLIWIAAGLLSQQWWPQFACFLLSTYLMVDLNNNNMLIRIYSRMVSCAFLMLSTAASFMFDSLDGQLTTLCSLCSLTFLFKSYQDKASAPAIFTCFFCVGVASMLAIHVLIYVPVMWLSMFFFIQSLSFRTLGASILGILAPYWFIMPFMVINNRFGPFLQHISEITKMGDLFDFSSVTLSQWLILALVVIVAAIGTLHYLASSYKDKFRTRQLYGCFITIDIFTLLYFILQPQHVETCLQVLIVNSSPLIAHFIALTRSRFTNVVFIILLVLTFALTVFNLLPNHLITL